MTKPTTPRTSQAKTALGQTNLSGLSSDRPASEKSGNQPVHHIRHGVISASIWRQHTDKGPMFNVTFQRSYRDGEAWKTSTSFGRQNLLVLSLIAARAYEWISNQRASVKRELPSAEQGNRPF
jgi:hypothetical protein